MDASVTVRPNSSPKLYVLIFGFFETKLKLKRVLFSSDFSSESPFFSRRSSPILGFCRPPKFLPCFQPCLCTNPQGFLHLSLFFFFNFISFAALDHTLNSDLLSSMAFCSLKTADFKVSRLDVSRGRVSTLPPCSLRNWIGRTPPQYSGLIISHLSRKALRACCSTSPETRSSAITRSKMGSEETKVSSLASQLIPNLHEVKTLLTNICDTSSIAEFELRLSGFDLHVVRALKSEDLPPPLAPTPAPVSQNTSSIESDLNGSVKTTSLALFKPEAVSSSPEGNSRFVEKATDEGLAILQSPKVGFFRRCRTIKGKRAPPSCKENEVVKEGQVLCYIDQLGAEAPIESDVSGEVVKILKKDGEPVGYGDALIAVLPSFPGIKKLQ